VFGSRGLEIEAIVQAEINWTEVEVARWVSGVNARANLKMVFMKNSCDNFYSVTELRD